MNHERSWTGGCSISYSDPGDGEACHTRHGSHGAGPQKHFGAQKRGSRLTFVVWPLTNLFYLYQIFHFLIDLIFSALAFFIYFF